METLEVKEMCLLSAIYLQQSLYICLLRMLN